MTDRKKSSREPTFSIVTIESDSKAFDSLCARLTSEGFRVKRFRSHREAATDLAHADLIVLDAKLKKETIHCSLYSAPILVAASNQKSPFIAGAHDILMKPWDSDWSLARIRNHLASQELRRDLVSANNEVRKSEQVKADFLAMMSHEIRTPVNGIIGMTSLLSTTSLSLEQKQFVNVLRHTSESLLTIINDVLDFSAIDSGEMTLEFVDFGLENLVEEALDIYTSGLRSKDKLEVFCFVDPRIPKLLRGDSGRIRQILGNLVSNAIKFTPKGNVRVSVDLIDQFESAALISFSVKDTGIGIREADLPKLFGSFTQMDASATRNFGGTGLGLSICKKLTEMMRGEISATSVFNEGSHFRFVLNLPIPVQIESAHKTLPPSFRLAVCSKSQELLNALSHMVINWEGEIKTFSDPENFLEYIYTHSTDAIVLDEQQNGLSGLDLARLTRVVSVKLIYLMSPFQANKVPQETLREAGIEHVLLKPVRASQLYSMVTKRSSEDSINLRPHNDTDRVGFQLRQGREALLVLVAEDNIANQLVATTMIRKLGHLCDVAANGEEAVKAAMTGNYSLIFMDCQMPLKDGLQATREIRTWERDIRRKPMPIIAMTSNTMPGDRESCIQAGMSDYLGKPVRFEMLKQCLEKWGPLAKRGTRLENLQTMDRSILETIFILEERLPGFSEKHLAKCGDFIQSTITELKSHIATKDFPRIVALLHNLSEASIGIGAIRIREITKAMVRDQKSISMADIERIQAEWDVFKRDWSQLNLSDFKKSG